MSDVDPTDSNSTETAEQPQPHQSDKAATSPDSGNDLSQDQKQDLAADVADPDSDASLT